MGRYKEKKPVVSPDKRFLYADEIEKCQDDFEYFASNYLKIIDRNKSLVPFIMKPAQRNLLERIGENPWLKVLKARQLGSSTLIAAFFFFGAHFLIQMKEALSLRIQLKPSSQFSKSIRHSTIIYHIF